MAASCQRLSWRPGIVVIGTLLTGHSPRARSQYTKEAERSASWSDPLVRLGAALGLRPIDSCASPKGHRIRARACATYISVEQRAVRFRGLQAGLGSSGGRNDLGSAVVQPHDPFCDQCWWQDVDSCLWRYRRLRPIWALRCILRILLHLIGTCYQFRVSLTAQREPFEFLG